MIFESEQQRQMVLAAVLGSNWPGHAAGEVHALVEAIKAARIAE